MDLDIDTVRVAHERADLALRPGERLLAGGTSLFSEPVPSGVTGLVDLLGLDWEPWTVSDGGAEVAATCTIATLRERGAAGAARHPGLRLVAPCVSAFLLSFKVAHTATVGGNLSLGLPAGPMAALFATWGGVAEIWTPGGGTRTEQVADLVTGPGTTTLAPGEVLRAVRVPPEALAARTAARRLSLTALGRSGTLVTGAARDAGAPVRLVVTAAVPRPLVLRVPAADHTVLDAALDRVTHWYADPHGAADWRAATTRRLAHEVLEELS